MDAFWNWLVHFGGADNLNSVQYGLQSGLYPNVLSTIGLLPIPTAIVLWYFHNQCHERHCFRMGHPHKHVVKCKKHFKQR